MGWMNDLFGGSYDNPADSAQPYLDKIPGYVDQYMQPFIDTGQQAGNILQSQYGTMAQNPQEYYNNLYNSYYSSPQYNYESDQLAQTQSNTAAAGGYSGTMNDQNAQMSAQNALLNADEQQYMNYLLGITGTGLQGEQALYGVGYNAAGNALATDVGYATSSAANQFGGTESENAMASGLFGTLAKGAGLGVGLAML